jgi:lipoprotein-releasing system ATP-binding protein
MLRAENITKSFGQLEVLKGVSLEIETEEIVSIVGASGAGKTTLLQILGTLESPDQGQIWYGSTQISGLKKNALADFRNQKLGFVFQFHHLLPEFTALENVCIPGFIARRKEKEVREKAESLLVELGLSDRLEHRPFELSGGEQQRVAVARALINDPMVVFADEPSGNLDSKNARELHELFLRVREEHKKSFVIVTHNEELAKISDRILNMKDGLLAD